MKANELRVGNWYHWYADGKLYHYQIEPKDFQRTDLLPNFEPIPLTEKWLLKFGFEVFEFDNGQPNQYRFKDRLLVIREEKFVDYGSSVAIKYVHQLQNLYFALTGQELQLKQQTT
jgi:hypothetical protein